MGLEPVKEVSPIRHAVIHDSSQCLLGGVNPRLIYEVPEVAIRVLARVGPHQTHVLAHGGNVMSHVGSTMVGPSAQVYGQGDNGGISCI